MLEVTRRIAAPPDAVFAVMADGWTYGAWVVGASRIRAVDADYPAVGTRFHHSVGVWPAEIEDHTEVTHCEPGRRLTLRARAWPAGEAIVDLELRGEDGGTLVLMREEVVSGPGRFVPRPVRAVGLLARNTETLRRLGYLAERRTRPEG